MTFDTPDPDRAWWFLDTYVVERPTQSPSGLTVLEMTLPEGAAPPEHIHHRYDDSFFVLEGRMVVCTGGATRVVGVGDWVNTPAGTPHAFRVVGGPARTLTIDDQPTFLELIRTVGQPALVPGLPPAGHSPSATDVFSAFAAHDVDVVGTSLSEEAASALLAAV